MTYSATLTPLRSICCSFTHYDALKSRMARMEIFRFMLKGKLVGMAEYAAATGQCPQCAMQKAGATNCRTCDGLHTLGILQYKKLLGPKFSMARWKAESKKGRVPCPKCLKA